MIMLTAGLVAVACGDNNHVRPSDANVAIDAAPDTPPDACMPISGRPALAGLTTGDLVIDVTQATNTAPIAVPLDRSVLFVSMNEVEPSPKFGAVICELHDVDVPVLGAPAGVTCSRSDIGTDDPNSTGAIHVHWTVATFSSGVSVQRGEVDTTTTNPSVVTLAPPVNPAHSFVLLGGQLNGGTGWGNNEFVRARLLDSATLDLRTNLMGTHAAWQLVTFEGANVQRGTAALTTTDTTQHVTTTAADPGSLVLTSYSADNVSGIAAAALMLRASMTDATTLSLDRGLGGAGLDVSWEVATLPFEAHSGITTFAVGELSKSVAVMGTTPTNSVALASNQAVLGEASGSTDYAGADLDLLGEAAATLTPTAGGVTIERASGQSTATIAWTVIDFSMDHCAGL